MLCYPCLRFNIAGVMMIDRLTHVTLMGFLIGTLATPAQADIYRCEIDGVIIFADSPCQDGARPYQSRGGISVVEAPSNLEEIEAANQALIRHRLAQQAERAAAARHRAETPASPPTGHETSPFRPVYGLPGHRYDDRGRHRPTRRFPEYQPQREQRYSALSGRLPGTRRRDRDD